MTEALRFVFFLLVVRQTDGIDYGLQSLPGLSGLLCVALIVDFSYQFFFIL